MDEGLIRGRREKDHARAKWMCEALRWVNNWQKKSVYEGFRGQNGRNNRLKKGAKWPICCSHWYTPAHKSFLLLLFPTLLFSFVVFFSTTPVVRLTYMLVKNNNKISWIWNYVMIKSNQIHLISLLLC